MKNKTLITSAVTTTALIVIGGIAVSSSAHAEENNYPPIVERLSERTGNSEDEIVNQFQENHESRKSYNMALFEAFLDEAVTQGDINEEQEILILEKRDELRNELGDQLRGMTPEERRAALHETKTELLQWAEENNIELPILPFRARWQSIRGDIL